MRYICESCERLIEPRSYAVERGVLQLLCPRCEETTSSTAEQRQAPVIPLRPNPPALEVVPPPEVVPASERCPKCASPKRGRTSCAKCGLVFELYTPELDTAIESLRSDFTHIIEHWGSPEAQQVIDRAGVGRLSTLARICRHHLADYPDDARARALLQQLHERSVALTMASGMPTDHSSLAATRKQVVLAGMLLVMLVLGGAMTYAMAR